MARDEGFTIADISTVYLDDEKVRRLWRLLMPDVPAMCEAILVHEAAVLASWREGKRVTVDQAAPLWLPTRDEIVARLVEVGLLDSTRRVPARSWRSYFEPARVRRDARRVAGAAGGKASGAARRERSSNEPRTTVRQKRTRPADRPDRPSVPSDKPSVSRARARGKAGGGAARGGDVVSFRDAMEANGYTPPAVDGSSSIGGDG